MSSSHCAIPCGLFLVLGCLLCASGWSQGQPPGPLPPRPGVQPQQAPPSSTKPPIRVRVNEVTAPVTVRDRRDELVLDLEQSDFHIFDNGAEQKIDHFDLGGDPLAVALVLETSSSIQPLIPAIHESGIVFTQTVMGATGQAAVVGFDDAVQVLQPFTSDQDQVQKAIERTKIGTSGRRLYDALGRGVELLQHQPPDQRRVMLVMSESIDSGSESRLGDVLRQAQLSNVSIYTIGLSTTAADLRQQKQYEPHQIGPPGTYPLPTPPGSAQTPSTEAEMQSNVDLLALAQWIVQRASNEVKRHQALQVASAATGGRYERTFKDRSMQNAMDEIGGELHAQYTLTYRPRGDEPSGFHDIKVTVSRPGMKVRTRPGYYLAPGGAATPGS